MTILDTDFSMHAPTTSTQAVQVLQMWNNWALVRFPQTGERRWVDLEQAPHAPLASARAAGTGANHTGAN